MTDQSIIDPVDEAADQPVKPLHQTVVEMIPQLVSYIGADHTYKFANAAYKTYFNVNPADMIGMHPADVIGRPAFEELADKHNAALAGRKQEYKRSVRLPSGRRIHFHARYVPHVVEGRVHGFLSVIQDITEENQSREDLRRSELKLRLIAENISDVFWMSTRGVGRMIYISPAYERLWERPAENLYRTPTSFLDAVHPDDLQRLIDAFERYHQHGIAYAIEYRIIRKDGEIRWIRERGYPVPETLDGECLMTGVCTDITDRKQTQAALEESEMRYRAVVEDQTELISRFKPDGTFIFVNETFGRFFGRTVAELIGNKWYPVAHEDDLPKIQERLRRMTPATPVVEIENRVWDGQGRLRWMQFVNRGFYDQNGQLCEIQSVGRDVTELKEKERLIAAKEKELEVKTAELEKLNTALEVVLAQRNEQLSKLKERINSNINKMILPDLYDLADRLKHQSHRQILHLACRNLEGLVSSDMEQLTSGKYNLTKTELKIATMIKNDMSSNEIASHLHISHNTVAFHRKNLRKKLGILQSGVDLSVHLKSLL